MIIESLCNLLFSVTKIMINLLPNIDYVAYDVTGIAHLLGVGISIIGSDLFIIIISNVLLWTGIHFTYASAEWVWKKIPGIN